MAKKKRLLKSKLRLKKQTWRRLRRDPWAVRGFLVLMVLAGFAGGVAAVHLKPYNQHPRNVVWAADKTVTAPGDLVRFLQSRDECHGSGGTDNSSGVGVWAVYQVSKNRFAKLSYGCGTNLSLYIMAVKDHNRWQLLKPADYFSVTGFLPKCSQIDTYQIDQSIEPYCIKDDGAARENTIK